ncbi:MAG: hypothetical protein JWM40_1305, partial [Frankiales bacterium]|nr:hypothetical protein [Frankiales bacterium]
AAPKPASGLRPTEIDSWPVAGWVTLPGKVFGHRAVWAGGTGNVPNTVFVRDLAKHKNGVLATAAAGWTITWVKASADFVVYMEEKGTSPDEDSTAWRMHAVDLSTGAKEVIASSSAKDAGIPPSPVIDGNDVVWVDTSGNNSTILVKHLRDNSKPQPLFAAPQIRDCGATGGLVVFIQVVGGHRDLYELSLTDGKPPPSADPHRCSQTRQRRLGGSGL